ncbi:testis-specific chromodomain protein Y 2 [Patella vulgata]|uniref:testis-specific chromodomain protein Y 2 n=1 Tax=Patella vulgata TaxID=6465 RepID=UPI00217FDF27|nr:testis-specific chromodomain protein Y 2 [Patella vulgata]
MADFGQAGIYEVEKLLKKRKVHGRTEYLIRWRGFTHLWDTWEPKKNLAACVGLVAEFEKNNPNPKVVKTPNKKSKSVNMAIKLIKKSKTGSKIVKNDSKKAKTSTPKFKLSTNAKIKWKKCTPDNTQEKKLSPNVKRIILKVKKVSPKSKTTKETEKKTGKTANQIEKGQVMKNKKDMCTTSKPTKKTNSTVEKKTTQAKGIKRKPTPSGSEEKVIKKKLKKVLNDDDDDDDVLYSLIENTEEKIKQKLDKVKSKTENLNKDQTKKLLVKTSTCSCTTSESPESVQKMKESPKSINRRLSLLDGLKHKPLKTDVAPLPVPTTIPFYTSVKPLMNPSLSLLSKAMPSHSITMESYFADIPSYQMASSLPVSPSAISYKAMLDDLPHQMHPKKKKKDPDVESNTSNGDDKIERRISVRTAECAFRNKEIVVKKCQGYTQIWLNTHTHLKNALNPQVIQEIVTALNSAKYDDSNLVMLSSIGNVFCSGVDLNFLTRGDPKIAARQMSDSLRELVKTFITFPKPIIAVVTGAAIGLGMAILPLCDITYASDKALFYLPYSALSQIPEGCSSFTLPQVLGLAVGSEILFCGRKLTALEAHQLGLVSQVFWPTSMMQEVIPRVQQMALFSGKALETTKLLIRCHNRTKLELTNETECNLLLERWPSADCQRAILSYLDNEKNFIF